MLAKEKSIFKIRTIAFLLDILFLFPIALLITFVLILVLGLPLTPFQTYVRLLISFSLPFWSYSIFSDFSKFGYTIGKKIMKIHVVTLEEERLSLIQAFSRTTIKLIPWEITHLTFFGLSRTWGDFNIIQVILMVILYVLIFFYIIFMIKTKGKRGFHDFISKTQVKLVSNL